MIEIDWHTEKRKVSDLKGWKDNPRTISDKDYENLKKSIIKRGFHDVLKIDEDNVVLSGNQRLKVLIELGVEEVECKVSDTILTPRQKEEVALESNTQAGEWDMDKLAEGFGDVMEEIGFEDLLPEPVLDIEEDNYVEPEDLEVTVKTGDIYQLGEHRLMCGDSTKTEDVERLMSGQKADMVFTDPPYGMGFDGSIGTHGEKRKKREIINDASQDDRFLDGFCKTLRLFNRGAFYISYWRLGIQVIMNALSRNGLKWRNLIIWKKNNINLSNSDYKSLYEPIIFGWDSDYEPVLYGWQEEHEFYGQRGEKDIWEIDTVDTIWEIDKTKRNDLHSTMKPIHLCARAILNSSRKGQKVLDLFGGSGSTLIACEQTNRKCYMMEIDPHYCQVIIDRWEKLTGEEVVKLEN